MNAEESTWFEEWLLEVTQDGAHEINCVEHENRSVYLAYEGGELFAGFVVYR